MKKILVLVLALVMVLCVSAIARAEAAVIETAVSGEPAIDVTEPFTWTYLASIAGAAAFTLLVVQFLKAPLDKIWKIPTRVFAYIVSLITMIVATAFTSGCTIDSVLLAVVNAFLAAFAAYGAYEVTFAKLNK